MATSFAQEGDIVLLLGKDKREFMFRLRAGAELHTHRGVIHHDAIIGHRWGEQVKTHIGYPYLLLQPSLDKLIRGIRRNTQIVYPKEIGYILVKMNIAPGVRVIEAGTGSGGLTLALARMVGPEGRVYTYEARPAMQALARRNLERLGLADNVVFHLRDIAEGFEEREVGALFLDVREPWHYLEAVHTALRSGGFFGALLPTTNQVSELLAALEQAPFGFVEVEELLLRAYKPVPQRLRPEDRMVAHTGYLVFARSLVVQTPNTEYGIPNTEDGIRNT